MSQKDDGAPAWLFSFVDLAFLMLIAMTQLAPDPNSATLDLGEMIVPRIGAAATSELRDAAAESWQLRVHPPEADALSPFELVRFVDGAPEVDGSRIEVDELRNQLAALKHDHGGRPTLAPHEDSRSQDMLEAAALLEEAWPGRRRAAVSRVFDRG